MSATAKTGLLFTLSALLGALVWFLSPLLTGHKEPWDANGPYYYLALIVAGFVPGCFSAGRFWFWAMGAWLGQVIAFIYLLVWDKPGSLWPLGLLFLSLFAVLSLVGAALGAGVRRLLERFGF